MCLGMCLDTRLDTCVDMSLAMCFDMRVDTCFKPLTTHEF